MAVPLRHIVTFFLISLSGSLLNAQGIGNAYDFLYIPSSSYVMGAGGVNVSSLHQDINLADQNPSLIGPENNNELKVGYMLYYGSSNFASVRYSHRSGEHGAWGAGVRYLNYGNFQGYDSQGSYTGEFSAQDLIAEATYSHDITYSLRGGLNVKFIYSGYESFTALAMAVDLGISYYDELHDFALGAVLKNMGGQLKRFEEKYERLPFDIQVGITKGLGNQFSINVTADNLVKWKIPYYRHNADGIKKTVSGGFLKNLFRHLVFGLDYEPNSSLFFNIGYNYRTMTDMAGYQRNLFSGFSIGGGFQVRAFSVGAAYAIPHKGASTLLINLGLDINDFL